MSITGPKKSERAKQDPDVSQPHLNEPKSQWQDPAEILAQQQEAETKDLQDRTSNQERTFGGDGPGVDVPTADSGKGKKARGDASEKSAKDPEKNDTTPQKTSEGEEQSYYKPSDNNKKKKKKKGRNKVYMASGLAGLFGGFVAIAAAIILLLGGAKLNHIRNLFIDYQFAKFHGAVNERIGQIVSDDARLSADSTAVPPEIRSSGLWERMRGFNADKVFDRLGEEGNIKFVSKEGTPTRWLHRKTNEIVGVDINGERIMFDDADLAGKLKGKLGTGLAGERAYVRAKIYNRLMKFAKSPRTGAPNDGKDEKGKTPKEAKDLTEGETLKASEQDKITSAMPEVNDSVDEVRAEGETGRTPSRVLLSKIANSPVMQIVRKVSFIVQVATILCLLYEAFIKNIVKVIDNKTSAYMSFADQVASRNDQANEGKSTLESVGGETQLFDGMEKSAAYHRAVGLPMAEDTKELPPENRPEDSLGAFPHGIIGSILRNIEPVLGPYCSILLNPIAQTAIAIAEIIIAVITTGGSGEGALQLIRAVFVSWQTVKSGSLIIATFISTEKLIPYIVEKYAGFDIGDLTGGAQNANKLDAGNDVSQSENYRKSGAPPITDEENAALNQEINKTRLAQEQQMPLLKRMFSLENPRSITALVLISSPSGVDGVKQKFSDFAATAINPFRTAQHTLAAIGGATTPLALADDGKDPYHIQQFAITKAQQDLANSQGSSWRVFQNSKIVEDYGLDKLAAKYDKCFDDSRGKLLIDRPDDCFKSLKNDEMGKRYSQYRFDKEIIDNLVCLSNDEDCSDLGTGSALGAAIGGAQPGPQPTVQCSPQPGQPALPAAVPMDGNAPGIMIVTPVDGRGGSRIAPGVREDVAQCVQNMISDAADSGLILTGSGFRDLPGQLAAGRNNGCPDNWTSSSQCRVPTAPPGSSNHGWGVAIDFRNCSDKSSACFRWLSQNASKYGFSNLPSEPWHWSINGR